MHAVLSRCNAEVVYYCSCFLHLNLSVLPLYQFRCIFVSLFVVQLKTVASVVSTVFNSSLCQLPLLQDFLYTVFSYLPVSNERQIKFLQAKVAQVLDLVLLKCSEESRFVIMLCPCGSVWILLCCLLLWESHC